MNFCKGFIKAHDVAFLWAKPPMSLAKGEHRADRLLLPALHVAVAIETKKNKALLPRPPMSDAKGEHCWSNEL